MMYLLDAGHGIDTPGKRSPDGSFREYLWNRDIAERLYELLLGSGRDVSYVVTETNDISLSTRVRRVNDVCRRNGKENVVLVSIHSNAAGNGSEWMNARGWSCYTSKGRTESDRIADFLYSAFEAEFPERKMRYDMSDGDKDWEADFYVCAHTSCPAVLLENFFYDNKEECAWLLRTETKDRIANAIFKGLTSYEQCR